MAIAAIYKPKELALGALDAPAIYRDLMTGELLDVHEGSDLFGYSVESLESSFSGKMHFERNLLFFRRSDPEKGLTIKEAQKLHLERILRTFSTVAPGQEVFREWLYSCLGSYIETHARQCGMMFGCRFPKTTLAALRHPCFGKHHHLGALQEYVDGAVLIKEMSAIPTLSREEVWAIGIMQLIACNGDGVLGNLLWNGSLWQIDAGACFPSFRGLAPIPFATHQWALLPYADLPLSTQWKEMVKVLDSGDLISALIKEVEILNQTYFHEGFKLGADLLLPLYASIEYIKSGVAKGMPLAYLATFQESRRGLRDPSSASPGEFWLMLELVTQELKSSWRDQNTLAMDIKNSVQRHIQQMLSLNP